MRGRHSAGFSLIDIMVGMLIGMLGIIIMMQLFSTTEGNKRATTGSADAQSSGAIALYGLQRDLRQSGYGINATDLMGCDLNLTAPAAVAGVRITNLAPVTINPPAAIIPAGDANTDTLLVIYGNANGSSQGDTITSAPAASTAYSLQAPTSFRQNDRVIATPAVRVACTGANALTLATVGAVPVVGTPLTVAPAVANSMTLGKLFNLGAAPKIWAYAVRKGNLTVCDYMTTDCGTACTRLDGPFATAAGGSCSAAWLPVANNIATLKAEYGRDTTGGTIGMDGMVDVFDQTTPPTAVAGDPQLLATAECQWARVSAIRLALVGRNNQFEKTAVSSTASVNSTWAGAATTPIDLTLNTNGTASAIWTYPDTTTDSYWQHYRYKVFQVTVPLKNVAWMGVASGC